MKYCFHAFMLAASMTAGSCALAQEAKPAAAPVSPAREILQKTFAAYAAAKSYQGSWSYSMERGGAHQTVNIEVKSKLPARLEFRMTPAANEKTAPGIEPLPELHVAIDGKTAWFENATQKEYYKVGLPRGVQLSPLMYLPQNPAAGEVTQGADIVADGRKLLVVDAKTPGGGTARMEVDAATYHIHRIVTEAVVGITKVTSTVTFEKETFDADIPDSAFVFHAVRGAKETVADPTAAALFGPGAQPNAEGKP